MKKLFILSALCSALIVGCTPHSYEYGSQSEDFQKSNLTTGVVKTKILKGETSQEEVIKLFGSPNIISKNKSNKEVWSYNKMSTVNKAGKSAYWDGARASVSSSSTSFDLIITFNDNNVVEDYSIVSTSF